MESNNKTFIAESESVHSSNFSADIFSESADFREFRVLLQGKRLNDLYMLT